eukprot:jgi/Mesvir1/19600/Mv09897-RA.3
MGIDTGVARADEGEEGIDSFYCEGLKANNLISGPGVPTAEELFDSLQCQPGKTCTRADVNADLNTLLSTGLFQKVDVEVEPTGTGYVVVFTFREKVWTGMKSFKVSGSSRLPQEVCDKVLKEAQKSKWTTVRVLAQAKTMIEEWYQERGFVFGTVASFDGMENGKVTAQITEGEITKVDLCFIDPNGNLTGQGQTKPHVIKRELPFKVGELYNIEDGKTALRDIFLLQLFDNVQVVPKPDEKDPQKVAVDIMLRERPMSTAEVEAEWSLAPGAKGRPTLVSIRPGGSVFFEHRNLQGEGRQLYGSVSTSNFFAPQDDLGYKVEYCRPYLWGDKDPKRTSLRVSAFNSRKLSAVFAGGDDLPALWVDRAGVKVALSESFNKQSKLTYGLVLEEITSRDESGGVCAKGARALPNGTLLADGPPTGLGETGTDRVAFVQANLTRDNTKFINGTPIGSRDIFTVDQSFGVGTGNPFFNRHTASLTRFLKVRKPKPRSSAPPTVLVLHARYGGCIGDLASYDSFTLGGPYSVRGFNVGELGAARRFLEVATELRVPVLGKHAYVFYEHGTDLGSSSEVRGNPTAYFRRAGSGSSYGCGLKLGAVRAEYAVDGNMGDGAFFMRFGERF